MISEGMTARTGLAVLAAGLTLAAAQAGAAEIRVLNWQGYGTDESWAVEAFSEATGHEVVHDYFNSEQEMLTKLRTNPGAYDVVLINSAFMPTAIGEGLIEPIDPESIDNFPDLSPSLRDAPVLSDAGDLYGIAWLWGVTSFAVNTDVFEEIPASIQVLWDPEHEGRVGWRDDAVESIQLAAIATGQDMNDPQDMDAIREKLLALGPQIRTFWSSEDEWNKAMSSGQFDLATYWSGSAARSATAFGLPVEFVIPEEGAIGWFDALTVAAGSSNPDVAAAFIDWMVDPEFYVEWDTRVGAPVSSNTMAVAALPDDAINKTVFGDPAVSERITFMEPMSDDRREQWLELWQEVKTEFLN
ncbi:MAG: extracellular solute-binding protein [Azospirillaceae bacterium]